MKIKLKRYKVFPYIEIHVKKIERTLRSITIGRTYGPVVLIDSDDANPTTDEHEAVHVAFWYIVTAIAAVLAWLFFPLAIFAAPVVDSLLGLVKPYKRFEESVAFGRSAAEAADPERYLAHYKDHWDLKFGDGFTRLVRKRMKWFS